MTTLYSKFTSSVTTLLLAISLLITSCSEATESEDEVTETGLSATLGASELSNTSGSGKITYTAPVGTAWSAEITLGGEFASFSISSELLEAGGTVASAGNNVLYFYLDSNPLEYEREGAITFCFEGSDPIELPFVQLSTYSDDSPYNLAGEPRWAEIPTKVSDENYLYVSHATTLSNGNTVRNFSLCFDIENRAAAWVAYPYHEIYDGGVDRTDYWAYDPKILSSYQANLTGSYAGSYDRGHQMPSADRLATIEMNRQTFYYSNMTPQLAGLNQGKWASLEATVRKQVCADTLYIITGADYSTTIGSTTDSDGKECPLPAGYFKVLLRTRSGYSGKAISECDASELQAVGFWAEHRSYSSTISPVSVKEIEEQTGFTFFPDIPSEVKESYTASDWIF